MGAFGCTKIISKVQTQKLLFFEPIFWQCALSKGKLTLRQILPSTISSKEALYVLLSKKIVDTTPTHITEILFWDTTQIRKVSSDFESVFDN